MGKKKSKNKNRKPFNPVRNAEKLFKLRPKLSKNKPNNSIQEPGVASSSTSKTEEYFASEKERQVILHIVDLLSCNSDMLEYHEELNAIVLTKKGKIGTHHLLITYVENVLKVASIKGIHINYSDSFFEYIMTLNSQILMGCFYYSLKRKRIFYKFGVPLDKKPEKEFLEDIVAFVCNLLDECVPEVFSYIAESENMKKENTSPTFH